MVPQEVQFGVKDLNSTVDNLNIQQATKCVDDWPNNSINIGVIKYNVFIMFVPVYSINKKKFFTLKNKIKDHSQVVQIEQKTVEWIHLKQIKLLFD